MTESQAVERIAAIIRTHLTRPERYVGPTIIVSLAAYVLAAMAYFSTDKPSGIVLVIIVGIIVLVSAALLFRSYYFDNIYNRIAESVAFRVLEDEENDVNLALEAEMKLAMAAGGLATVMKNRRPKPVLGPGPARLIKLIVSGIDAVEAAPGVNQQAKVTDMSVHSQESPHSRVAPVQARAKA